MKRPSPPQLVSLALATLVAAISLAVLEWVVSSSGKRLAGGIVAQMEGAPPESVEWHLAQLEGLQADAVPALVTALGSERPAVVRGAQGLLNLELDRWRSLPPEVGSRYVEHLARLLSGRIGGFNAASRENARQLALRIMDWPLDRETVDRTQVLLSCELVLRAAGEVVPPTLAVQASPPERTEVTTTPDASAQQWRPRPDAPGVTQGDAELTTETPDFAVTPSVESELPTVPEARPGVLLPPVGSDGSQSSAAPAPLLDDPTAIMTPRGPRTVVAPPGRFHTRSAPLRNAPIILPNQNELENAETITVMRWLIVEEAEPLAAAELSERGFSAAQIRVSKLIVDPDPNVRLKVTNALPNMSGIDPRPWLLWLSRDTDPAVRRETVAILATSTDPEIRNRLRELAVEETDATVLRVVQRALEQRAQ